jgi:hypothetical protein
MPFSPLRPFLSDVAFEINGEVYSDGGILKPFPTDILHKGNARQSLEYISPIQKN